MSGKKDYSEAFKINFPSLTLEGAKPQGAAPKADTQDGSKPKLWNPDAYDVDKVDAQGIQSKVHDLYDKDKQAESINDNINAQQSIVNRYDTSAMQNVDPNTFRNHAKNPTNGRLNDKSAKETQRASRLADAYNNRRHAKYGLSGTSTRSYGSRAATNLGTERYEPIETQEMRQMRADENIDTSARNRQVNRAENTQDLKVDLERVSMQNGMNLAQYVAQSGVDLERNMQRAVQDAEYSKTMDEFFQRQRAKFTAEYGQDVMLRLASYISNADMVLGQIYGQLAGTMPMNYLDRYANEAMSNLVHDMEAANRSPQEIANFVAMYASNQAGARAKAMAGGFMQSWGWGGTATPSY